MMDLAMNFDADECLVTAMFDKGNRNDTMEAIDHIIPFLKGDADMIGLVCNTIRKLFCMSDEGYEVFLMDLEEYKWNWKKIDLRKDMYGYEMIDTSQRDRTMYSN